MNATKKRHVADVMIPQAFIDHLDRWTKEGGRLPLVGPHDLTTVAEAQALCRAVASPHVYMPNQFGAPALFDLMGFFQASETQEATRHLRDHGLPILRRILIDAVDGQNGKGEDEVERRKTLLFVVKVLAAYQQHGDAALIAQAARAIQLWRKGTCGRRFSE
jgi:hypothetical protein